MAILIEASAGNAIAEFKKVGAAAKGVEGDVAGGTKSLGGLGQAGQVAGNLLKAGMVTAAAGAGAAIAKFAVDGVNAFVEVTGEIRQFNRVSGATAEEGSKMVALFNVLGISTDDAARAIGMLGKNIDANVGKLQDHGIEIARNAKGNVDLVGTLLSVGDAYKATNDPAARAGLAAAAFGKSWQTLTPILEKSRGDIEKIFQAAEGHGLIFSQEQLDKGKEFGLATRELSEAVKGVEVEIGSALVPVLTDLAIVFTKVTDSAHNGFLKTLLEATQVLNPLIPAFKGLGILVNYFAGSEGNAAKAATEASAAQEEQAKNVDGLNKALFSLEAAHHAVDEAVRSEATAERELGDKQKTLNDLLKKGAVDLKAVAAAHKEVAAAEVSLTKARRDQTDAATAAHDAEQTLADLRSGATAAKNAVDHADDVGKAQLGVTRATKRLSDAQDALTVLQNSGTATSRDLSDAQDNVTQATYDLHDANTSLITTQDTVNKLQQVGAENSPEVVTAVKTVKDANQTLADATQHVADAIDNVATKQAALGTALAGDPNYSDKVREARQAVADATQHVADAMYNVAQNKEKFEQAKDVLDSAIGAGGPAAVSQVNSNIQDILNRKPELALLFDPMLADLHEAALLITGDPNGGIMGAAPGSVLSGLTSGLGPLAGYLPRHAAGGPISGLSVVGEKGPELFAGHGTIIPNNMLGGGGGTVVNVTVNAGMVGDADRVADDIYAALMRLKRRNGNLGLN